MDTTRLKKWLPLGLTIGSCLGAIGIVIFSHKDTLKANQILVEADGEMSKDEARQATWKCYIPTGLVTLFTIGCSAGSYILKEKQLGALATGLALTGGLISEYKDAIKEKFGEEGYEEVVKAIAKPHESEIKHAKPNDIATAGMLEVMYEHPEEGNQLFYDPLLHVWFRASKNAFDLGRYYLNRNYVLGKECSVRDLYDFMGVELDKQEKDIAESLMWGFDENSAFFPWLEWIDIGLTPSEVEDGEPYYIIEYVWEPGDASDYIEEYEESLNES